MKPETLHALLTDRALGELSPEVAELLDAYLAANPLARQEAETVARTVWTTRETIRRFPELAKVDNRAASFAGWFHPWLARAAALLIVLGASVWLGYLVVRRPSPQPGAPAQSGQLEGLWTEYKIAYDERGAVAVVTKSP